MRSAISLLALAALLTACDTTKAQANMETGTQLPKQLTTNRTQSIEIRYLLYLPKDYSAKSGKRWPMILFLHGAGERGTDIRLVTKHGPPRNVQGNPDFPFILVSPQCPLDHIWFNDSLLSLLDEIVATHAVNPGRIYLTGISMGGYGAWDLGLAYPERFAAIAPICGGGEFITPYLAAGEKATALNTLGVWAFHGAKDPVVPLGESQRMVDLLKKQGVREVKFTIYPDAEHDSWTETYNNPELYEWFLRHERK